MDRAPVYRGRRLWECVSTLVTAAIVAPSRLGTAECQYGYVRSDRDRDRDRDRVQTVRI